METVITCLTSPGKAAIATLAVRGPNAWEWTRSLFRPRSGPLPDEPAPTKYWFGKLGIVHADDAIVAVKEGKPHPCIEVHCHGGVEVVRMVQELFVARGAVLVSWQEFVDNAPLLDLLARATTMRTAGILLDQINGAWNHVLAKHTPRLAELIPVGQHLVEPWKVVIAGAPNVGKSSLMNALAGYTRSVVAPTPGTTRDVVRTRIAIDGWPIELIDTAGIRDASSEVEAQGIERARQAIDHADLRFWLLDGSIAPVFPEVPVRWQIVINKTDLPAAWDWEQARNALRVSAQTGAGLSELCEFLAKALAPHPPAPGEAVPCLPEHVAWVTKSWMESNRGK
jgi:tRNA modification GTPase